MLVIGSIDDTATLETVLAGLTDVELLTSLYAGEGGNYCQQWIKKQVKEIFKKIGEEIKALQFELGDATLTGIQFKEESFRKWTELESAVIYTIPCILVRDQFLPQVFELVGLMDDVCHAASKALSPEAREKGFSAATAIFSTTYIGGGVKNAALTKIFSTLQSGFATFRNAATISDQSIPEMLKKRSLKHGQFYFLLSLLRYDDKLRLLYPYVLHLLKNWRAYPYHLVQEVLQQVAHSYETEEQRRELVAVLNKMHGETQNAWLSTSLFDALGDLGALEDDAAEYEPSVADEIRQAFAYPLEKESWDRAAGIYYAQFDHPYNSAYQSIIRQLPEQEKKQFLSLALQGYYSSIFTTSLIRDGWANLQAGVAPFLVRWTEVPIINPSFPQDSITVFLVAHILLAKSNYPVQSRYGAEQDEKRRSLFAAAEIYYWLNRADAKLAENMIQAKAAADILFLPKNAYVIESIWQLYHNLSQSGLYHVFEPGLIMTVELAFPEMVVGACRASLNNIGFQTEIENFPRDGHEIVLHTIWLLENTGSIIDLDVLRPLTDHVVYGESAVKAIKELSLK